MESNLAIERVAASASFPEGAEELNYVSLAEIRQRLIGRRVSSVEYAGHNVIALIFEDGSSVTFTPSGTEGDDLELSIARSAAPQGAGSTQDVSKSVDERLQETVKAILCDSCCVGEEPVFVSKSESDRPLVTADKPGTPGFFLRFSTARRHLPQTK
ncbi:hypothetical protein [Cupriavidus nantongensis]|uniref:hypothetical protein n=1 Tax=Cupriavidus nantongensis TaxID=1796606 RepID=UPI0012378258|nr:hypothetical protein [Cupriavidus nantongensis]